MSNELNWIQKLPNSWMVKPLKAVANYSVSNVDKLSKEDEIPVELCNYTDVYKNDFITSDIEFMLASATEEEIRKFQLNIGDVLITKDSESWDDIAIPALVIETKGNLLCGYHLAIIQSDQTKIIPEYLFRCIEAKVIRIQLELASTGVTRFGLPKDEIGRLKLPIPNLSIQAKVISFLKIELLFIDRLITQKEQLISLLSEKRRALITQAVTRGIDPNVKLKKSGIDWLGDVPEHWEVIRVKFIGTISYGLSQPPQYIDDGVPLIRATNVERGLIIKTGLVYIDEDDIPTSKKIKLSSGDIIVVRSGAYTGDSALVTDEWDGAIAGFDMVLKSNKAVVNPRFLSIVLLADYVLNCQLIPASSRAAQPHLNAEELGNTVIGLPPLDEQEKIIEYLHGELSIMINIKHSTLRSIELLKERRTALISAAVTGQIEIPEML